MNTDPTAELLKGVKFPDLVLDLCLGLVRGSKPIDTPPDGNVSARVSQAEDCIYLFGSTSNTPTLTVDLVRAVGELIERKATAAGQADIWRRKLVLPDATIGEEFNTKLRSRQYSTYRSLVESFTGAVSRLQALHIANALIANKVPMADAYNLDVTTCGYTATFATGKAPYSITPLVSAYCEAEVWKSFSKAFQQHCLGGIKCRRSDVGAKLEQVIEAVCAAALAKPNSSPA